VVTSADLIKARCWTERDALEYLVALYGLAAVWCSICAGAEVIGELTVEL